MRDKEFNKKIGINIKRARLEANMTQKEMSQHLGLSRESIVNIEKGRQSCSVQKLVMISKVTGFSVASIIADVGIKLPKIKRLELPFELHKKLDKLPEKVLRAFIQFNKRITPPLNNN